MGMTDSTFEELKGASGRPKARIDKLLKEAAEMDDSGASKAVELRFLMNPTRIEASESENDRVGRVICERTKLEGEAGHQQCVGTGEMEEIPADLVLVSIGYRGMPLESLDNDKLFDSRRGVVLNDHGKVPEINNLFVTGWIKRGPTGIIGTNITDAKDTVSSILKCIDEGNIVPKASPSVGGRDGLVRHFNSRGLDTVSWNQSLQIERAEKDPTRLRTEVQPREKILAIEEMLAVANKN
jgi:adrenodoxin-NADP+ reductase